METGTKGANAKGPVTPVAASGAGKRKAVQPSPYVVSSFASNLN
jgi:hypothetical protein